MKLLWISVFGLCFFNLTIQEVYGQVTVNQFLRSVETDPAVEMIDEQSAYLMGKPYSLSVINRFQFRLQNNEGLNKSTQRFGLWLSPANPWAIKSTNKYFKTYSESLSVEREIAIKKALYERYVLIVEFLSFSELQTLYQKDLSLLDAQLHILEKQQASDYFNAAVFADLKLEQIAKDVQLDEVSFEIDNQINRIDTRYTDAYIKDLDWNYSDFISVEQIEKVLDTLRVNESMPISLNFEKNKIELAKQSYNIQKSNINTGFIQGNYLQGNVEKNKTPWSFVAGITIPIANPNKGDMAKKQLQVIEATKKSVIAETVINGDKIIMIDKLKNLIARYKSTQAKIDGMNIDRIGSVLGSMREGNPMTIVKLNSSVLKLQLILLKLKQNIMLSYIDYLNVNDKLQSRPYVNYLSPVLKNLNDE